MVTDKKNAGLIYRCASVFIGGSIFLFAGCITHPKTEKRPSYHGPTQSMSDVVAEINANNERLPTLWARHYYEATVIDENKKPHFVNGDGALLYRRPYEM